MNQHIFFRQVGAFNKNLYFKCNNSALIILPFYRLSIKIIIILIPEAGALLKPADFEVMDPHLDGYALSWNIYVGDTVTTFV